MVKMMVFTSPSEYYLAFVILSNILINKISSILLNRVSTVNLGELVSE